MLNEYCTPSKVLELSNPNSAVRKHAKPSFLRELQQDRFRLTHEQEHAIEQNKSPFKPIAPSPYLARYKQANKQAPESEKVQAVLRQLDLTENDIAPSLLKMLLNSSMHQSTVYSGIVKPQDKSLYFSLLALLLNEEDGITVIITPHQSYLKERMRKINQIINWGAINPQVEQAQRDEVFKHLENGTLKLLFVHPEMAHSVAHHQIKLLLMDEAQSYIPELDFSHSLWSINISKAFSDTLSVQIFIPTASIHTLKQLELDPPIPFKFVTVQSEMRLPRNPITVSRDEHPLKQLATLFRSPRLFKKFGILVYCNSKAEIEECYTYLVANGFKCAHFCTSTNESKRQSVLYDFAKHFTEILIIPCGILLPEALKQYVYLTIHLNMPVNIETLLYDISELNAQANSHIFANDLDFIVQRNRIASSFINVKTIDQLFGNILAGNVESSNITLSEHLDQGEQPLPTKEELTFVCQLKIAETLGQLDLSRNMLFQILQELIKCQWVHSLITVPYEVLIKITSHEAIQTDTMLQCLKRYGRRYISQKHNVSGSDLVLRCQLNLVAMEMSMTIKEIVTNLKALTAANTLTYSIIEETIYMEVSKNIDRVQCEAKVIEVYTSLQRQVHTDLLRLDQTYSICKEQSFKTLEHMWRQVKMKGNAMQDSIETYLTSNVHPSVELPFIKISTQREKSNLIMDVQQLIEELSEDGMIQCDSWIERESFINDVLIVLQSLKNNAIWTYSCKSSKVWKKYEKYRYESLQQILWEWIPRINHKKVKL